jgi:hypothetical protein
LTRHLAIGFVFLVLAGPLTMASKEAGLRGLPRPLHNYRQWTQFLEGPRPVPFELWIRCMAPTPADWKAARETYGPHAERFVQVYGNELAVRALPSSAIAARGRSTEGRSFPIGTAIAKEKLSREVNATPEGVAFMIKRGTPRFADSGGWEFLYFPNGGPSTRAQQRATHEGCASCHRAARSRDYVFEAYPR